MEHLMSPINIEITARGEVSDEARQHVRKKLAQLERFVKGPIVGARVVLIQEPNPRIPMPAGPRRRLISRAGSSALAPWH